MMDDDMERKLWKVCLFFKFNHSSLLAVSRQRGQAVK